MPFVSLTFSTITHYTHFTISHSIIFYHIHVFSRHAFSLCSTSVTGQRNSLKMLISQLDFTHNFHFHSHITSTSSLFSFHQITFFRNPPTSISVPKLPLLLLSTVFEQMLNYRKMHFLRLYVSQIYSITISVFCAPNQVTQVHFYSKFETFVCAHALCYFYIGVLTPLIFEYENWKY